MATEREILLQILEGKPEGTLGLFHRHGALYQEALIRFYGSAGKDHLDLLTRVVRTVIEDLKQGKFDDISETFYDWIVRCTWCTFMTLRFDEIKGDHLDPEIIYACSDRLSEAALPEEVRQNARSHFNGCDLCRGFLDKCNDIPLEVRHAGAKYSQDFKEVLALVAENLRNNPKEGP